MLASTAPNSEVLRGLERELEEVVGHPMDPDALRAKIRICNRDRKPIRRPREMRNRGRGGLISLQMQHVVKCSMIMDESEHTALLERLMQRLESRGVTADDSVRLHLSARERQELR